MKALASAVFIVTLISARCPACQSGYAKVNLVSSSEAIPANHHSADLRHPHALAFNYTEGANQLYVGNNRAAAIHVFNSEGIQDPIYNIALTQNTDDGSHADAHPCGLFFNTETFVLGTPPNRIPPAIVWAANENQWGKWSPEWPLGEPQPSQVAVRSNRVYPLGNFWFTGVARVDPGFVCVTDFLNGVVYCWDARNSGLAARFTEQSFIDPTLPAGYSPYNMLNIGNDQVVVAFAQRGPDGKEPVVGAGKGYVSLFNVDGTFIRRLATKGKLNAPYGLIIAPPEFVGGNLESRLLVGNYGDGRIHGFSLDGGDAHSGVALKIRNATGRKLVPFQQKGLRALIFGAGAVSNTELYFSASPNKDDEGLIGRVSFHQCV